MALLENTARVEDLSRACVRVNAYFPPSASIPCDVFNGRNVKEGAAMAEKGPVTIDFHKTGIQQGTDAGHGGAHL